MPTSFSSWVAMPRRPIPADSSGSPRRRPQQSQAHRRRSALHALGLGGGLVCAYPVRHGHHFLGGLINYLLSSDKIQRDYVVNYTDLTFIVKEEFAFTDGIYSGYNAEKHSYDKSAGNMRSARTVCKGRSDAVDPRCVYSYSNSTTRATRRKWSSGFAAPPRTGCCNLGDDCLHGDADARHDNHVRARVDTAFDRLANDPHRRHGAIAARQYRHGRRRHERIARAFEHPRSSPISGLLSNLLPGYITLPSDNEQEYGKYVAARALKPLRPNQLSYWQNMPKFLVSFMKAWWGDAATAQNSWAYDYLPKLDKLYDMLQVYELMHQGKMNGYLAQGFNPLAAAPNKAKMGERSRSSSSWSSWIRWRPRPRSSGGTRRAQRRRLEQDPD